MEFKTDFKVAICTKGRYETLDANGNPKPQARMLYGIYKYALENDPSILNRVFLFVEPQDALEYKKNYSQFPSSNIIVLGDNNMGISFVRQTALMFFQNTLPTELVFMLDDDLTLNEYKWEPNPKDGTMCYRSVNNPNTLELLDEFVKVNQELPEWDKVGSAGVEYHQFAWTSVGKWPAGELDKVRDPKLLCSNHGANDCCVLLKPLLYKELGIQYDAHAGLKEDRDINAQIAFNGLYTRKFSRWVMVSPANGTNKGGCASLYAEDGRITRVCAYVVDKWAKAGAKLPLAEHQKKTTKYGRSEDVKFHWRRLFYAKAKGNIKNDVVTEFDHPDSIYNYKPLNEFEPNCGD